MSDDIIQEAVPVSEEQQVVEEKQVPLSALEAERHRRQEAERAKQEADRERQLILERLSRMDNNPQPQPQPEDEDEFLTKGHLKQSLAHTRQEMKRDILEEAYLNNNPKVLEEINEKLPDIIKKKPWVADVIKNSSNRWSMAKEIVDDYAEKPSSQAVNNAKRIVENNQKPVASESVGAKKVQLSEADYIRSIQGTAKFTEYRKQIQGKR